MEMLPERMEEEKGGHDHIQQNLAEWMELVGWEESQGAWLEDDLLPELEVEGNLDPVHSGQWCPEE